MAKRNCLIKKRKGLYIIGSITLAIVAFIVMPKLIDILSTKFYGLISSPIDDDNDNWGPEIVRKVKITEEKPNGEL